MKATEARVGKVVEHEKYGKGIMLELLSDTKAKVRFADRMCGEISGIEEVPLAEITPCSEG